MTKTSHDPTMQQKGLLFLVGLCLFPFTSWAQPTEGNALTNNVVADEDVAVYAVMEEDPSKTNGKAQAQGRSLFGGGGGDWDNNGYSGWNPMRAKEQLLHSKLQFIFSLIPRIPFGSNPVPPMYGPQYGPPGQFPGQPPYYTQPLLPGSGGPYPGGPVPVRPGSTCYLPPHCYNPVPMPGLPPCYPICPSVEETVTTAFPVMASVIGKPTAKPGPSTSNNRPTPESSPIEEDSDKGDDAPEEPAPETTDETDEGESRKKFRRPNPGGKSGRS